MLSIGISPTGPPHAGAQELQQQLTSVQAELAALSQGGDDVPMVEAQVNAGAAAALAAAAPAASEVGDRSCQAVVLANTQHAVSGCGFLLQGKWSATSMAIR